MKQLEAYQKFLQKAANGEELTVLFLGGSITAGAATYPREGIGMDGKPYRDGFQPGLHCWRERTFRWLQETVERYPGQLRQINAGIGGTGSLFGAIRLNEDVLKYKPDFLFLEFAVNDNGVAALTEANPRHERSLCSTLLNILNRVTAQNPEIAVFMPIATYRLETDPQYSAWVDNLEASARLTTAFCQMFEIPFVSIYDAYYRSGRTGAVYLGDSSPCNSVHPSSYGHEVFAQAVCDTLQTIFQQGSFAFDPSVTAIGGVSKEDLIPFAFSPDLIFPQALHWEGEADKITMETIEEGEEHAIINGRQTLVSTDRHIVIRYAFRGGLIGAWFDFSSACDVDIYLDHERLGSWSNNVQHPGIFSGDQYALFSTELARDREHLLEMRPAAKQELTDGCAFRLGLRALIVG